MNRHCDGGSVRVKARRKWWLKIHLYLGLCAGAALLVIGLTGSLLTFWLEIDRWLNPELTTVAAPKEGNARPMSEIVAAANAAMPSGSKFEYAYPPASPEFAYLIFYSVPTGVANENHSMNVFVDPYTAKVIGTRVYYHATRWSGYCFIGLMFKLHYALLAGNAGSTVVGILGVLFLVSVSTGLILWWPRTGKWRQALTIKSGASAERLNYDLHKSFGIYSALILTGVLISGISMNLNTQFKWLVRQFSPVDDASEYHTSVRAGKMPVTVDEAWKKAQNIYPQSRLYWFSIPNDETGVYVFTIHGPLGAGFYGRRKVVVDRYGETLRTFDSLRGTGGNVFMQWMWPLHSGYFLGMTGRVLVLLTGLACSALVITGFIRWLQKRRAHRLKAG